MSGITLPANSYCKVYDYRVGFDLKRGKLTFDISPTVFQDTAGFIGASLIVTSPSGIAAPEGFVIIPGDMAKVYEINLPKVNGVYHWGAYTISSQITLQGNIVSQPLVKQEFLSPPDCKGDINYIIGMINITVDCKKGAIIGRGFSGYAYNGKMPISEEIEITRYYPPEAELAPQKDITKIPFVIPAYEGINKFKGINTSTYDEGDNITVIVEIKASEEKNVRCLIDYEALYCGVQNELAALRSCDAPPEVYNKNFTEINALLWTVTAGSVEGKDVSEEIARLEQLLGIDCSCQACAGKRVGEDISGLPINTTTVPGALAKEFMEGEFSDEFN
jgi:hypothetical protein